MKIALVSPYDWCVDGGVKSHIAHLAAHFRQWGHEVTIFAPASEPAEVGGECVVMGKPWSMRVSGSVARITFSWSSPTVKRVLAEGKFDVVHLHEPLMPLLPVSLLAVLGLPDDRNFPRGEGRGKPLLRLHNAAHATVVQEAAREDCGVAGRGQPGGPLLPWLLQHHPQRHRLRSTSRRNANRCRSSWTGARTSSSSDDRRSAKG